MFYTMNVAGLKRDLPLCRVNDDLYIGAFVIFGDVELTVACARELLKIAPEHDILITAESKGIPLVYEMARQHGENRYLIARKAAKRRAETEVMLPAGPKVAVTGGALDFGTWERIFYGEFDGRRKKRVLVKIIGE